MSLVLSLPRLQMAACQPAAASLLLLRSCPHSETGHFHIKSMPKCGKIGAASTAGWGAGVAIFSPVGRVVLLQKGGSPPQTPPPTFWKDSSPRCDGFTAPWSCYRVRALFVKKRGVVGSHRVLSSSEVKLYQRGCQPHFQPHTPNSGGHTRVCTLLVQYA